MDGNVVSFRYYRSVLLLSRDEQIIEQLFNYGANHQYQNYDILNVLNTKDSIIKSTPIQHAYKGRLYDKIGLLFKYGAVINDLGLMIMMNQI